MIISHKKAIFFAILIAVFIVFFASLPSNKMAYSFYSDYNVYIEEGFYGDIYLEKDSLWEPRGTYNGALQQIPIDESITGIFLNFSSYEYQIRIGENGEYENVVSAEIYAIPLGSSVYIRKKPISPKTVYSVDFYRFTTKISTQIVEENCSATPPQNNLIQVEGYTFVSWDKDFSCITENTNISAIYTKNSYNVYFYIDDTLQHTAKVEYNTKVSEYIPQQEHYYFTPFMLDYIIFDYNMPIKKDISLFCTSIPNTYTLSFYIDDNLEYTKPLFYGEKAEKYTKQHYSVSDFFMEDGTKFDFENTIACNTSIYATSVPETYTVKFFVDNNLKYTADIEYNKLAPLYQSESIPHYTYSLYKENASPTPFDFTSPITQNLDLFCNSIPNTYSVYFYIDDELLQTQSLLYGSIATKFSIEYEYFTLGDYQEENQDENFDFAAIVTYDTFLYANKIPNTYTISFFVDDILEHTVNTTYNTKIANINYDKPFYLVSPFKNGEDIIFDYDTLITKNFSLYATTQPNFYTIEYYINETLYKRQQVEKDSVPIVEEIAPNVPNDTFIGWQKFDCNQNFDFSQKLLKNITLYALYDSQLIEVCFDLDGGNAEGETVQRIKKGFNAIEPTNVTKAGYQFIKWQGESKNIQQPIQIKASYKKETFTVNYFVYEKLPYQWSDIAYGEHIEKFYDGFSLKAGDKFLYWHKGDDIEYDKNQPITSDINLYCKTGKISYDIVYHFRNKTNTITLEYASQLLRPTTPECEIGYMFENWYTDEECSSLFLFNGFIYENKHIYGKQELMTLIISFSLILDEESFSYDTAIKYNEQAPKPSLNIVGYDILWYKETECINIYDFSFCVIEDTIVYGKAYPKLYNITFDCSLVPEVSIASISIYYLEAINLPQDINRYGYTFDGYLLNNSPFILDKMPAMDISLIPSFSLKEYILSFDCAENIIANFLTTIELPIPQTIEYQYFDGWLDASQILHTESFTITENMSFTAKYTIIRTLNVCYNDDSFICKYGDTVEIPTPQKENFVFLNWYRDENLLILFNNIATVEIGDTLFLYSKWIKNIQTITTIAGDNKASINVSYGELSPVITPIELEGHKFIGWFVDEAFTLRYEQTLLYEDCFVYGTYEKKVFIVKFIGLNDKILALRQVSFMDDALPPTQEELLENGFIFDTFRNSYESITQDTTVYCDYSIERTTVYVDKNGNELKSNIAPQLEGYVFERWELSQEGGNSVYSPVYVSLSLGTITEPTIVSTDNNSSSNSFSTSQNNDINEIANNDTVSQPYFSSTLLNINGRIYSFTIVTIFSLLCCFFVLTTRLKNKNNL